MEARLENILNQYKMKITQARCAILEILLNAKKPLCYNEIKDEIKIKMDKTTFYRNIISFEDFGIINKFESNDRKWYYELNNKKKHAHFICDDCNKIICFDFDTPDFLRNNLIDNVLFKGKCQKCQTNLHIKI